MGKVEFQGSRENNILPREQFRPYFFKDRHEKDPAKRYKGLERTGTTGTPGMQFDLYYSPDGFQWTPYENNPIIDTAPRVGRWGPTGFMGWDPIRQTYAVHMENCAHLRCPLGKRLIGRAESPDMIHWSQPETIILPDEQDYPDLQFYHMALTVYEGMYVGMLWNFRTTNTSILPQAVFSRDGIHYNRDYREPFIPPGPNGSFDSAVVYAQDPKVHEGRLLNYYTGVNWRSPESLHHLGDKALGAVGLAVTPPDGFVSLDGVHGHERQRYPFSEVVTRSFTFTGDRLHLNVRSALRQWGAGPCEVRVEIIGADHHAIEGYGFDDAGPHHHHGPGPRRVLEGKERPQWSEGQTRQAEDPLQERQALLVPVQVVTGSGPSPPPGGTCAGTALGPVPAAPTVGRPDPVGSRLPRSWVGAGWPVGVGPRRPDGVPGS